MTTILRPTLELTVLLPGMLLAYLPVIPCLKQSPRRLAACLAPLLLPFVFWAACSAVHWNVRHARCFLPCYRLP